VTGYCGGAVTFGAGEPNETTLSPCKIFIARYRADGTLLWVTTPTVVDGGNDTYGRGIAVTPGGGAVIAGEFGGTMAFGSGGPNATTLTSSGRSDAFLARLYADGGLAWVKQAGGAGYTGSGFVTTDSALTVGIGSTGAAYFAGDFTPPGTFGRGEPGEIVLDGDGGYRWFVAKVLP
jgi:hypothetical protein